MKVNKYKVLKPIYESSYGSFTKDWKVGDIILLEEDRAKSLNNQVELIEEILEDEEDKEVDNKEIDDKDIPNKAILTPKKKKNKGK